MNLMNVLSFLLGNIVVILIIAGLFFLCWETIKKELIQIPLLGWLGKIKSLFSKKELTSKQEIKTTDGIRAFHDLLDYQLLNGSDEQVKRVLDLALDVRPKPSKQTEAQ